MASSDNNNIEVNLKDLKMFESLDLNGSDPTDGSLEDNCGSFSDDQEQECKICKQQLESPRVLSCLHVFCENCLTNILNNDCTDAPKMNSIVCPDCKQTTTVGPAGVASLHNDYVLTNILDLNAVEPCSIACTSCKSKDNAMSRCNDCANFLCASCDNAHKYMRCFENHKVVLLDELRESTEKVAIHKPLFCQIHSSENLKYYCFNCQVPVCNDCLIANHKGAEHHYESIADAEKRMRSEIEKLCLSAKAKVTFCDGAVGNLNNSLTELQSQHDTAREQIEENYESFKQILDRCRETALKDLEKLHSERELKIMDLLHDVEKSVEKIEIACKFAKKVLNQANGTELLSLKKTIGTQILNLINHTPQADVNFSLDFDSNYDKFNVMAQDTFGKFRTESTVVPKENTPPPTLPGMPPVLSKPNGNCSNSSPGTLTGSVTTSSPISLTTSMQSSFDGDMSVLGNNYMMPPHVISPNSPPIAPNSMPSVAAAQNNISCLSIAEYNLHRLANIGNIADGGTDITDGLPSSTNGSPSPHLTLADLISGDQRAFHSFQAMAKMGLNNNDIVPANSLMPRGPSPGIDSVSLLNDFMPPPAAISPIGTISSSLTDDMGISMNGQVNGAGRSKATPMQIRCKFGSLGASKGQFNSPHGFCLGVEEEIIVADTNNHRIEVFEKSGTFKFQFGVPGKEEGQLWYPRKVAVMRTNSKFVVCDRGNERSRMQIFTKNGHFIKKIAIRYIDIVAGLAVTNQGHIVAVDSVSPTVFIISEDGELVRWFDCSDYMREPSDIAISGSDFYVCDFKGHCVAVFTESGIFQHRIGHEKITCFPNGIDISDAGDILIGDSHGNRFHVACFSRDGVLQSEFECPYVKVSRCCGLKITSEGYIVTLAKNNHHVLVLNTLYIQ
ncbi:Brain tumor protein [Pseudolycoriella hygida]|uniref:Brain tumor protein n=1 Tax=Pseudolycoriella hygida TaxID=35572 RepID=A0A9Q0MVC2_9DIPT|nr:Brain tumor protein [Pseudolycoriella hygida]